VTPASPLWYITRGAGMVTLIFLTLSFVLGILTTAQYALTRLPRFVSGGLHRNVALAAVLFAAVHVVTAILDPFAHLRILDAAVPFVSAYRSIWLGFGVVSAELVAILILTSLVRGSIGHGLWRAIHWAAYAAWPLAIIHGLGTGSDEKAGWAGLIYVSCVLAVVLATVWRLFSGSPESRQVRVAGGWALAAAVGLLGVWAFNGPLQPGWALAAGTPPAQLRQTSTTTTGGSGQGGTSTNQPPGLAHGLDHALVGQAQAHGEGVEVDFQDQTDPGYQVHLILSGDDNQNVEIQVLKSGSLVCDTTLQNGDNGLVGKCGATSVQLNSLQQDRRGRVTAELVTG